MKVVVDFTHNFAHSGIGTYSRELVKAMAVALPDSIFVLYTLFKRKRLVQTYFANIPNVDCRESFPNDLILGKAFKYVVRKFKRMLWRYFSSQADLVHYTDPVFFTQGLSNALVTIHDIIPLYTNRYQDINRKKLKKYRTDVIVRDAVKIIVPSFYVRKELERYFPECIGKVDVVYEGVKEVFLPTCVDKSVLQLYGLSADQPFFLIVGRLEERKNIESVVAAFKRCQKKNAQKSALVIVGNGSESLVRALQNQIDDVKLRGSIFHLTGVPDEHLVHLYNAALALVFVSYSEGFGLPLVEAMSCGCPSIVSNCSSLPEIADGSALLVDPYSIDEISRAMMNMLEDKALRAKLVERCKVVVQRYSWKETARQTLAVYKEAIDALQHR